MDWIVYYYFIHCGDIFTEKILILWSYELFCGVTVMRVNATYLLNNPRYLLDHLRNNDIFYNYLFKIFLRF